MIKKLIGTLVFLLSLTCIVPTYAGEELFPYEITVNLTQNIVTVYNMDKNGEYTVPKKAFYCSVGEETPTGTFQTTDKYKWRPLFGNVYGQYATRITGYILFHSVPYIQQDKGTLEYEEYNKLGETASMGCIRMTVEDVKWIYDNCLSGTTVKMYRSDEPEPLTPPQPQKIESMDSRRGWDPTDPDVNNPWNPPEIVEMSMKSGTVIRKIEGYYQKENYALLGEDAQLIFGHLGVAIALPQNTDTLQEQGEIEIVIQRHKHKVSYIKHNGKVYFNLRDLGKATGTSISWAESLGQINLEYTGTTGTSFLRLFPWKQETNQSLKSVSLIIQ